MSPMLEALIHQLSTALGHGPGRKSEDGRGPFPAVMTAQPFAEGDPDALAEGDPDALAEGDPDALAEGDPNALAQGDPYALAEGDADSLGESGDVWFSNLEKDHLSKDQPVVASLSLEARSRSRKIILLDGCRSRGVP